MSVVGTAGYEVDVHRWVDHTGEMELELDGATAEDVLAAAVTALAEVLGGEPGGECPEPAEREVEVEVEGSDRARLFAAWLAELAFLAETEGFVAASAPSIELDGDRVRATLRGRTGAPAHLVKAVTYHRLAFEPAGGRWYARAVLDV